MDNSESQEIKIADSTQSPAQAELNLFSAASQESNSLDLFSSFKGADSNAATDLPDTTISRGAPSANESADLSLFESYTTEREKPEDSPKYNWDPDFKVVEREGDDRFVPGEIPRTGDRLTDTINTIDGIPDKHQQMVVVTTANKGSTTGELRIYQRDTERGWVDSGERIPINVGRNGLNWGVRNDELLDTGDLRDRRKVEGDGTGPIGLFTVSGAFGLKSQPDIHSQLSSYGAQDALPYRQIRPGSQWVSTAQNYNRWIDGGNHAVKEDLYKIAGSGLYEYGLVLGYNGADMFNGQSTTGYPVADAQYKGGSAIFAHVERGPGRPTAGCTSMSRENMLRVMATLNHGENPLWLQIPRSELDKLENRRFTR